MSDTASNDASADKSGPTIQSILQERGFDCRGHAIVPDEVDKIQAIVKEWSSSSQIDWIITTGGTGFGVRDKTPEVKFRVHYISYTF